MPNVKSVWQREQPRTLHIQLDWNTSNDALAVIATQRIAEGIERLWFAGDIVTRGSYIEIRLRPKRKTWSLVNKPLSKGTIERLIRTINNKMPDVAAWAAKDAARLERSKADHPARVARGLARGVIQTTLA